MKYRLVVTTLQDLDSEADLDFVILQFLKGGITQDEIDQMKKGSFKIEDTWPRPGLRVRTSMVLYKEENA